MIAAILLVYVAGYVVTTTIAASNWFDRFGVEFEGVVWAMFVGIAWPLLAVPYLIFLGVKELADG